MSVDALIYPMFTLALLTFSTLVRLFATRVGQARAGTTDLKYFKTYQEGSEPAGTTQLARNFSNLLEAPTLFYAACLSAMVAGVASSLVVGLAWLYVAARVAHTFIHTGGNDLYPRIGVYFFSWAVLLGLWAVIVLAVATRG